MADSITIDKGESKAFTVNLNGDLTADKTQIEVVNKNNQPLLKFSTDAGDAGYTVFASYTYDAGTDKTAFTANIEASTTSAFPTGFYDVTAKTTKTQAGFAEGYVRIERKTKGVIIQDIQPQ